MARILYLHQHFSTPAGATGTRSHAFARALAQRGHAVTLACGQFQGAVTGLEGPFRQGARRGRVSGFGVVEFAIPCGNAMSLARRSAAFLRYAARASLLALRGEWDLVIASSTPLTVAIPALLARRTPFLFEIRDPWPELPAAMGLAAPGVIPAMSRLADAACGRAAAVVALTEGMGRTALARGTPPERLHVIGQGCDLDLFGPQILPWRPEAAASHEMLAAYAGAHGRANGLALLLGAAGHLQAAGERRVRLLLVGEGGEKAALMAEAAARGLANVTFLDPLPKPDLARLLAGSQVGLMCLAAVPEFAEWTAPNKLMDYLAAGLPVLSNVPGEAARLLEAGACGQTHADAASLAAALTHLATDRTRRLAMGQAARDMAQHRFDRRLLAARFVDVVEAALAPRAVPLPRRPPAASGRRAILLLSAAHPADDMRVVRKEGAALAAAGWPVLHLCPHPGPGGTAPSADSVTIDGVAIESVAGRSRLRRLPALYRRAVALRPAAIHASEPDAWAVALLAGWRCGARVVLDVHEHYPSRLDTRLPAALRPLARLALRAAMRLMSRLADATVLAKDGLAEDFSAARPRVAVRNHALVPAGLPRRAHAPGPVTLLHLGAIGVARGWPQLLAALALMPRDTRLLVIGRFTDGSEPAFRAAAERADLTGRIELAGWMPAADALARAAAEADVNLVLFQPGEENHRLALPHKLFDGMAVGLPVIVPDFATGVAGIVRETGCGLLADVTDPTAIAAAVARLADPALRASLGEAGRQAAHGAWGWEAEAARLVALYRGLLAAR